MKQLFAHNGVDHGTAAEAVSHSVASTLLTAALVSAAVVLTMAAAVWATKRFVFQEIEAKDKED